MGSEMCIRDRGMGVHIETASFNGLFIGFRWALEGLGAPLFGRLVDLCGWRTVAPAAFGLSCANGLLGFLLLRTAEAAGQEASGLLLLTVLLTVVVFFLLASAADLCVNAMGVTLRQAPLLVQVQVNAGNAPPLCVTTVHRLLHAGCRSRSRRRAAAGLCVTAGGVRPFGGARCAGCRARWCYPGRSSRGARGRAARRRSERTLVYVDSPGAGAALGVAAWRCRPRGEPAARGAQARQRRRALGVAAGWC